MDAPYQARDDTPVMRAGSGGASIHGIMPTNVVEVKRELVPPLAVLHGVDKHQAILAQVRDDSVAQLASAPAQ